MAQIYKQSLAAITKQGPLTSSVLQGEACTKLFVAHTKLPDSCSQLLAYIVPTAEPTLLKELLESYFNQ